MAEIPLKNKTISYAKYSSDLPLEKYKAGRISIVIYRITGEGPIHLAAGEDEEELIRTLVHGFVSRYDKGSEERVAKQRAYVNQMSNESDTALHLAAQV